jgi:hypothetical protein
LRPCQAKKEYFSGQKISAAAQFRSDTPQRLDDSNSLIEALLRGASLT